MRHARRLTACGVIYLAATVLPARDIAQPDRGARLRLTLATGGHPLVGAFVALDGETLTLQVPGRTDAMILRRDGITRAEISEGRRSRTHGALLGAAIGAGSGAIIGIVGGLASTSGGEKTYGAVASGTITAFLLGSIGAGVGLVLPPAERWKELPLDRVRLTLARVRGRGAALSVTFLF